jgi:ubiquinone biosynthesis monooxygenase Coq7
MCGMPRRLRWHDGLISAVDEALRTVAAPAQASRPSPAGALPEPDLTPAERQRSAALMRVNHAGEIAAQALYHGQSVLARSHRLRRQLATAAREERDHLAWCAERLEQLGGRTSILDPLWYAGSFCVGLCAASLGDRASLGFIAETEKQVEAHLNDHLSRLPSGDGKSTAILRQMTQDEAHHRTTAALAGGSSLPLPARKAMALGGGLLRRVALFL